MNVETAATLLVDIPTIRESVDICGRRPRQGNGCRMEIFVREVALCKCDASRVGRIWNEMPELKLPIVS